MKRHFNNLYSSIQSLLSTALFQAIDAFTAPAFLILNLYSLMVIIDHFTSLDFSWIIKILMNEFPMIITLLFSCCLLKQPFLIVISALLNMLNSTYLNAFLFPVLLYYLVKATERIKEKHYFSAVPQFVENSLKDILMCLIILLLIQIVSIIPSVTLSVPFLDSAVFLIIIVFLHCLLFYNGIHPGFLKYILYPIEILFLFENITNFYLGMPLTHLLTHGLISAMCNLSGTGITFGIALLDRSLPSNTCINSFFGVNEPVLFGLPIVHNKAAFIPYVLGGTILGTLPIVLIKLGYLNYPVFDAPYIGLGLEGFLVNLDFRSLAVAIVQIFGSILIWLPYYRKEKKHEI